MEDEAVKVGWRQMVETLKITSRGVFTFVAKREQSMVHKLRIVMVKTNNSENNNLS